MAPLSFLFVALALASMHGALGAPSDGSPPAIQPMPTSIPSVPPSSSGGPVSETDIQTYLDAHNGIRSQYGAEPLTWGNEMSSLVAQVSANECGSYGYSTGENMVAGPVSLTIRDAVASWAWEAPFYNASNPGSSLPSLFFTQVIWNATTQVACSSAICTNGVILPLADGPVIQYVCVYDPPCNVPVEFDQNVQVVSGSNSGFGNAAGGPGPR